MNLRLDHAVHVVRDLEAARSQLISLGLHVVPGGEHPGWGTRNALAYFDLTYLELVAVRDPAEAASSHFGGHVLRFAETGEGLATAALATDDLDGARRPLIWSVRMA